VVFTTWNSRQDFLNWIRSDEFVQGHAKSGTLPKDAYSKSNVLELHEVLQDSARPDWKKSLVAAIQHALNRLG